MARILVVDDEANIRSSLRRQLEEAGHEVAAASDGVEGLAVYECEPADVVLVDLMMPIMDGFEVIETLREQHPEARIIAMSGIPESQWNALGAARDLGAGHTLAKPFTEADLLLTLQKALAD
jgi:two-component system response regulator (stage 0 sporulation protein F)